MKQTMRLSEFKKFCEEHPYREVVYDTRSQEWHDPCSTVVVVAKRQEIYVSPFLNRVYLNNGDDIVVFELVKSVEIDMEEGSDITEVILTCKNMAHENPYDWSVGEIRHKFTAYAA